MSFKGEVWERVGLFDLRLGPGASGFSEDTEFSIRICKAGFKIGYTPHAVVYHELNPERVTVRHTIAKFNIARVPAGAFIGRIQFYFGSCLICSPTACATVFIECLALRKRLIRPRGGFSNVGAI